ncbi:MAG TPA: ATP-binding protein [Nitrolancea sp.]|jgi:signal transduction histidine kinase|nr:ATP-binding protein [Nitrolancea sp.]
MRQRATSQWVQPVEKAVAFLLDIQIELCDAPSVPELMGRAVEQLHRVPGTIASWIYQRDERGELRLVHSWEAAPNTTQPIPELDLGQLLHQRWIAAHRADQASEDFAHAFVPDGFPSQTVAPMLVHGEMIGAVVVERRDGDIFPYETPDLAAITTVAALTSQTLQILVLRSRIAEQEQQTDVEQARREFGRTLHDGIVQDLAYMNLKLELLERRLEQAVPDLVEAAAVIRKQVNLSITNLRSMITDLRRRQSPAPGITAQLRDISAHIPDHVRRDDDEPRSKMELAPEIEKAVIGIVREAIQNIRKHANASDVRVEVQLEDEELLVTVADDGVGFGDQFPVAREGHFGMEQMRELAEDMGGSLLVESVPGSGTRVHARIPLILAQSKQ